MSQGDDDSNMGPCCACGISGRRQDYDLEAGRFVWTPIARNIVMYDFEAPAGFTGWACVVCDLPPHGAIAVLCDRCAENGVEPKFICGGKYATEGVRVSLDGYERKPFHHNTDKHPELRYQAPEEFEGEQWEQEL